MEEDEKPKKKTVKERYWGMKKKPKFGKQKQPKKKYGPFSKSMKIKPGMSDFQKRTMKKFMEVKPGETLEQWRKRTATRRIKDDDEIESLAYNHKLRIGQRSRARLAIESKNKYLIVQPVEREFDFLRYYGIVCNYYAIKYGLRKEDIEIGFYFYENIPFQREKFENAVILMAGTLDKRFQRFIREGLMEEIIKTVKVFKGPSKQEKTGLYRLTKPFVKKLTSIYRTLGKMNGIPLTRNSTIIDLSPEVKQIIKEMNNEIQEILTGRKPRDLIKPNK